MRSGGSGSIPEADNLDSGFHPFGVGKMSNRKYVVGWPLQNTLEVEIAQQLDVNVWLMLSVAQTTTRRDFNTGGLLQYRYFGIQQHQYRDPVLIPVFRPWSGTIVNLIKYVKSRGMTVTLLNNDLLILDFIVLTIEQHCYLLYLAKMVTDQQIKTKKKTIPIHNSS